MVSFLVYVEARAGQSDSNCGMHSAGGPAQRQSSGLLIDEQMPSKLEKAVVVSRKLSDDKVYKKKNCFEAVSFLFLLLFARITAAPRSRQCGADQVRCPGAEPWLRPNV